MAGCRAKAGRLAGQPVERHLAGLGAVRVARGGSIRAMAAKADEPMGCGSEKCSEAAAGGEQMGGGAEKRSKAAAGVQTPTKPLPTSNEQSWTPAGKSRKKALPPSRDRA